MLGVRCIDERSRPPHRIGSNDLPRVRWSRPAAAILALAALLSVCASPTRAQDPNRTTTIFVGGFDRDGASRHGVFGVDGSEALLDSIAALVGAPVAHGEATLPQNAAADMIYYGDTPPPYYTAADVSELARVTAQWGGGVPRYALIVAKYARELMRRSGARQVNIVSGSFGSLIVRWMIEKDLESLASSGAIARWLSVEGLLGGNWAASRDHLVDLLDLASPLPIDVDHMDYDWVTANIHSPRNEADSPFYANILVGAIASTDDDYKGGLLTDLMLAERDWQPNDGLQLVSDALFQSVSARSQYLGLPPLLGLLRNNHFTVKDSRGGWADVATFLTQRRRVAIIMTDATLKNISEPTGPFWDWRPAEVVLESRVTSPAVAARWGITDPLVVREKEGGVAPLRRFNDSGEHQRFTELLFDGMVLPEENELRLDLHAEEVDYDWRYNVHETITRPYYDELGAGSIMVSTLAPGTYTFDAPGWSCAVAVLTFDYPFLPFQTQVAAVEPRAPLRVTLAIAPNPHLGDVRISVSGLAPAADPEQATLDVHDVSGRLVRHMMGDARQDFLWDGRGESGVPLPAGVYLYRLVTPRGAWSGRSVMIH
jgi:flagellar hook capping protein FlgD